MNFLHREVTTNRGDSIQVSLRGNAANVRVMDCNNFQRYRTGGRHEYFGGHYTKSPVVICPPSAGTWHVVVDLVGYRGRVVASVRVLARTGAMQVSAVKRYYVKAVGLVANLS